MSDGTEIFDATIKVVDEATSPLAMGMASECGGMAARQNVDVGYVYASLAGAT